MLTEGNLIASNKCSAFFVRIMVNVHRVTEQEDVFSGSNLNSGNYGKAGGFR